MAVLCANKIVRNLKRKNQNNPNHQTNNLTGNKEADRNNRQQYHKKTTKSYNLNCNNKEILNW